MAIAPIQILGGRPTDAIGQILGGGVNVLQNVLNAAVESGRRMADNQLRQEEDFASERRDLRLLGERRGNELQRRFEATRAFDESVRQSDRTFSESVFRDRRDFDRGVLTQDRAFGLDMAGLGMRGAELGMRAEENKARLDELGLRREIQELEVEKEKRSARAADDYYNRSNAFLSGDGSLPSPPTDESSFASPDTTSPGVLPRRPDSSPSYLPNILGPTQPLGQGFLNATGYGDRPAARPMSTAPVQSAPVQQNIYMDLGYRELEQIKERDTMAARELGVPSTKFTALIDEAMDKKRQEAIAASREQQRRILEEAKEAERGPMDWGYSPRGADQFSSPLRLR